MLQMVCKAFRWLPARLRGALFNLNAHLQGFVLEPDKFRQRMQDCDAIISRGFALNFFVRGCSQTLYLDVFVQNGQKAESFTQYITEEESYVTGSVQDASDERDRDIHSILLLQNLERKTTIRIVQTASFPLLTILQTSCTTADLNFILCDKAYSLFPALTIQKHVFYPLRDLDNEGGRRLVEYAHQGWTNRDFNWPDWSSEGLKGLGHRRIGDNLSLVVHLQDNVGTPSSTLSHFIEHSRCEITHESLSAQFGNSTRRRRNFGATSRHVLTLTAKKISSYSLRRPLTDGEFSGWGNFVRERLSRWTRAELFKIAPGARPAAFDPAASSIAFDENDLQTFTQPLSWDYADDQLPRCHLAQICECLHNLQTCANIGLKWNLKNGGTNHIVKDTIDILTSGRAMVVGYDVTHPTNMSNEKSAAPSLIGMVASVDKDLGQWPASRLLLRRQRNQDRLPEFLIIYRNGVSEGQFTQVLTTELPMIRKACDQLYAPKQHPRLSIIVSIKRHQTRFYPTSGVNMDQKSRNIKKGTVIDCGVSQARYWDFFLTAHTALKGTARPAHYTVLMDEIFREKYGVGDSAADQLEKLTHNLCYPFGRATKAFSICPPAYYADIVCERARVHRPALFDISDAASTTTSAYQPVAPSTNVQVHPNLRDTMYYI
ncbi:piwi domain-containing protein [Colletotrichum costaricense]|uniref:Piwi domain-containing protein n=1 Tax=Colletotrichum costaricense TaxID=1209916 RepID=A0AAI9YEP2_9PEZI|nr:piwi domain-containing protein [Colletotrichum costaricense]KAK1503864.1 piwi domain-containing protein [Colletotrichum costaricense]